MESRQGLPVVHPHLRHRSDPTLAKQPGTLVRAFVGYSGWSAGQLESELRRNAWIVTRPPNNVLAVHHDKALWAEVLRHLSPFHRILAEAPDDPFAN